MIPECLVAFRSRLVIDCPPKVSLFQAGDFHQLMARARAVRDYYLRRRQAQFFSQEAAHRLIRLPALSARPHSDAQDIALPAEHRVLTGARRNPDFHAYHERVVSTHSLSVLAS
jgi:hypothetical protein